MDELQNPFSPGAGSPPPELAGRDTLLHRVSVMLGRIRQAKNEQSMMLVGLRGVGKTVLLNRVREQAEALGFGVVMVEATENRRLPELLAPGLRQVLFQLDAMAGVNDKVKRGLRILRSFIGALKIKAAEVEFGLEINPERGTADSGDLEADLSELLCAIGEAGKARGKAIAIIVDEIQYLGETEMSALIMGIHRVSQRQLPLILVAAGLPQLVGLAGRSKSYAERLFTYPQVGPLGERDAKEALTGPVAAQGISFTEDALNEIVRVTRGYAYFLQEWGYQSWNLATASPIDIDVVQKATAASIAKLDESFFRVRFDRLTPREKDYMRAVAELGAGPHRSGDIADCLRVQVRSIAPLRSGLIKKGMIYSPAHGDTAFTVPLFDEFMRRTIPVWQP